MKFTNQRLAFLLSLAAFIFNFATYSPGFLSIDSLDQYRQALNNEYVEWHPSAMAYLWHLLNSVHKGPQVMLAFQLILLWGSYYMLATATNKPAWTLVTFLVFFFAPFIHNFAGYIIKDAQMALCWLFALSAWIKYYVRQAKIPFILQILSLGLLAYGSWVRYNSLSALLPICLVWSCIVYTNSSLRKKIAMSGILFFAVIIGQKVFIRILKPYKQYPQAVLYMHDLSAMFVRTGENVFPPVMYHNPQFDTAFIRSKFHPAIYDYVWWNPEGRELVLLDDSVNNALHLAWINMIRKDTKKYLENRWETFSYFLRFDQVHSQVMFMFIWIQPNEFGYVLKENRFPYTAFKKYMHRQEGFFYWDAWFWAALNLALFLLLFFMKDKKLKLITCCVLLSGILYLLPQYFLSTTDKELRYIYWECIACLLACFVFAVDKLPKPGNAAHINNRSAV